MTQMSWNDEACSCMLFNVLQIVYIFTTQILSRLVHWFGFRTKRWIHWSEVGATQVRVTARGLPQNWNRISQITPEHCANRPPRAMRAMSPMTHSLWAMTLWNPWNRTISTVLWVHLKLPQSSIKLLLCQATGTMSMTGRAKRFVIVPLRPYFGFHWFSMTTHPCPILPIQWTCSRWLS